MRFLISDICWDFFFFSPFFILKIMYGEGFRTPSFLVSGSYFLVGWEWDIIKFSSRCEFIYPDQFFPPTPAILLNMGYHCLVFLLFPGTRTRMLLLKSFTEETRQRRLPREKAGLQERLQCCPEFNTKIW